MLNVQVIFCDMINIQYNTNLQYKGGDMVKKNSLFMYFIFAGIALILLNRLLNN